MCLQTKSSHLSKGMDCTTPCYSLIVLFKMDMCCFDVVVVVWCIDWLWETVFLVWFYLASKYTCILCQMDLLVCLDSGQTTLYLTFLYVYLYIVMYFSTI